MEKGSHPDQKVGGDISDSETKVIYHIDEEETPYLVKVPKKSTEVCLRDFKAVIPVHFHKFKFFFKSKDDDFGVVKEEIVDEDAILPLFNGRVVSWLVAAEGSVVGVLSDGGRIQDRGDESENGSLPPIGLERSSGVGTTRPPSFHGRLVSYDGGGGGGGGGGVPRSPSRTESESIIYSSRQGEDLYDDTESSITSVSQRGRPMAMGLQNGKKSEQPRRRHRLPRLPGPGIMGPARSSASLGVATPVVATTETSSSMMSSEIESSSYEDTEDDGLSSMASSSRFTTSTDHTSVSRNAQMRHRPKKRSRRKIPAHLATRAGSISSVTDSTLSLNIITVTLNMDTVNFLGISIVGQSNKFGDGDCGIYVGSIMKGGAVALDGRIEPGDMILQVNETNFEKMSNDEAVTVLREVVQKPGPIKLVVAKCWDPSASKGYNTLSMRQQTEPVRPIDPGAWVAHTAAVRGLGRISPSTLSATSIISSHAETVATLCGGQNDEQGQPSTPLDVNNSSMLGIVRAMQDADSGLEVRDRLWLKIKIPNAFLGSDAVDWLYEKVEGFQDRREARKYASQMLKTGFIKHTVKKTTFSEQCYYAFGDDVVISSSVAKLNLQSSTTMEEASCGGVWGVGMTPWTGHICNPTAPPPSANYPYPQPGISSSGSSHLSASRNLPNNLLPLAGSGSGSEATSVIVCGDKMSIVESDNGAFGARPPAILRAVQPPIVQ